MSRTASTFGKPIPQKSSTTNGVRTAKMNGHASYTIVTEPLHSQSSSVVQWSKSLRDKSPSPVNGHQALDSDSKVMTSSKSMRSRSKSPMRSRSKSPMRPGSVSPKNTVELSTSKSQDFGPKKSRNTNSSLLRKSTTNSSWGSGLNLTGKSSKSQSKNELADIESEYIKNLQQQIYFLELESNYLREQARKATELHPKMTVEAERMLVKLRKMQNDMDEMQLEMRRKDNNLNVTLTERERAEQLLIAKEDNQHHEKLVMREEIISLKKAKDRLELEGARKNSQLLEAKTEVDKSTTALRNAEYKLSTLKNQLDQRTETLQMTQIALEEKRAALMVTESQLRDTEDTFYNNTVDIQDNAAQELRDEIRMLRQKVKELELTLEKERFLKEKMEDENGILTRENSNFSRRLTEYQRHLDKEKEMRENIDLQQRENISELITLRDREKQLDLQLIQSQSESQREKERCQSYLEQLTKQESLSRTMESELNSTKLRLAEFESMQQVSETENTQLRKDKMLLVDHVAELQRKIETKDHEIITFQSEVSALESRLYDLDYQKNLESTVHSQKWQEFGRLAESMRTLSSTMAHSTSPTHSSSKLLQY